MICCKQLMRTAVAAVVLLAVAACADEPTYALDTTLHLGMKVYLGGDGGGAKQTVCPTLKAYFAYEHERSAPCVHISRGTAAILEAVIENDQNDPEAEYGVPLVRLRGTDHPWEGFTSAGMLQPDVRPGTLVSMHRDWGAPLSLRLENSATLLNLETAATVHVLRYDPVPADRTMYVLVFDGPYKGKKGWMGIQDAATNSWRVGGYMIGW